MQEAKDSLASFKQRHSSQLQYMGFPDHLYQSLKHKLENQIYDIGDVAQLLFDESEVVTFAVAKTHIPKHSGVYLIDHAWTFRPRGFAQTLRENQALRVRMYKLMYGSQDKKDLPSSEPRPKSVDEVRKKWTKDTKEVTLDQMQIASLKFLDLPQQLEELSLWGNQINKLHEVVQLVKSLKNLKALWLNNNPVSNEPGFQATIQKECPHIELLNSEFTKNARQWALLYIARKQIPTPKTVQQIQYIDLSGRGVHKISFSQLQKLINLKRLNLKDNLPLWEQGSSGTESSEGFQSSKCFEILKLFSKSLQECIVQNELAPAIALASKTLFPQGLKLLNGQPLELSLNREPKSEEQKQIQFISQQIWKFANPYILVAGDVVDQEPCWYIMDEVGSAFQHSDTPNFVFCPFLYKKGSLNQMPKQEESKAKLSQLMSFTLAWPTHDIDPNDKLMRDFLFKVPEEAPGFRSTRLAIWFTLPQDFFLKSVEDLNLFYSSKKEAFKQECNKLEEQIEKNQEKTLLSKFPQDRAILVYTDYCLLENSLTLQNFEFTEEPEKADILYVSKDISHYKDLKRREEQYLSQFPFQGALVMKNNLDQNMQLVFGNRDQTQLIDEKVEDPLPIQPTFDLQRYAPAFLGEFYKRERNGENNIWIVKPTNLARSLDTIVTNSVDCVLKQMQTIPKIAQKYIERPLLFYGKKFDLRFDVLVKSMDPPEVYIQNDFWIRISQHGYSLDPSTFSDMRKHMTATWYGEGQAQNLQWKEFIEEYDKQYGQVAPWSSMKLKIIKALKQMIIAAAITTSQMKDSYARALYGVDLMINDSFNVKILECTFSPDCERGVKFNPEFFNDIFRCFYTNDKEYPGVERIL